MTRLTPAQQNQIDFLAGEGLAVVEDDHLVLSGQGRLLVDAIAAHLALQGDG